MILRPTLRLIVFAIAALAMYSPTFAFQATGEQILVTQNMTQLDLIAGATQPLQFEHPIPKILVQVPEVLEANAVSANEILLTGLKPGISMLTVVDNQGNTQTLSVSVNIDVRPLQRTIDKVLPASQVTATGLTNRVVLSGYLPDAEQVSLVTQLAEDFFPEGVIGNMQVTTVPNVAIQVKIYEVSRSKLRRLGVDWAFFGPDFSAVSSFADVIQQFATGPGGTAVGGGEQFSAAVVDDGRRLNAFIEALEQHNIAKLLDEPTLVAKDGRPAEFLSGGEIPFQVASGLGNTTIEFRPFGTKLDIVPNVLGRGRLTMEVRAEVSEIDNTISTTEGVPGFRVRRVNTAVDMPVGHTLALAGDYREEIETLKQGAPKLMDHPFWGIAFRRTEEVKTETELVFLMTPRFIDAVEAERIKRQPFGKNSQSPSDRELYINGHSEVPFCAGDGCAVNDGFRTRNNVGSSSQHHYQRPSHQLPPQAPPTVGSGTRGFQTLPPQAPPATGSSTRSFPKTPTRSRQASGFSWPSR